MGTLQAQLDRILGLAVAPSATQSFFYHLDADRDGQASFAEFKAGMLALSSTPRFSDGVGGGVDGEAMMALVAGPDTAAIHWSIIGKIFLEIISSSSVHSFLPLPAQPPLPELAFVSLSAAGPSEPTGEYLFPLGHRVLIGGTATASISALHMRNSASTDALAMLDAHFFP